jgi:hypothetical protein
MSGLPRVLVIMGSGETAPTMVKVHRGLLNRLGPPPVPAVLLDTPYGFQENADDISARAVEYFRQSVGHEITVASWRSAADDTVTRERALARIGEARYVFAGPGSPTYALGQWAGSALPALLAAKLREGGCVTFASAAALTLGHLTVPVYEVYQVGEPPVWRPGLDLLGEVGLHAAVIPHYDNAEGGNHDTRFCYLGERRLAMLEQDLDDGAFVLGVDEHTACILDLDDGTATIAGLGGVTVRRHGESTVFPAGEVVAVEALATGSPSPRPVASRPQEAGATAPAERSPLLAEVARLQGEFDHALADRKVDAAVAAILELDDVIAAWSADTLQSDEPDRARAALRAMIVRLGEAAVAGVRDPRELVAPFVDAVLAARRRARDDKAWDLADDLRDRLTAAGIELHDTPAGTEWEIRGRDVD